MTKKEDSVVLSYFDCIIRESDLKILRSNCWLNDAIIGFYFVFIEKEHFHANEKALFIGPEVTQCLKESPSSELPIFLDPLEANDQDFIFFAVNDSGKSAGGSHWSLLLFIRSQTKFYHIDSSSQTNYHSALKLAHNLDKYLCPTSAPEFQELESLQQDNSYDCGIYLICNLANIAEFLILNGDLKNLPIIKKDTVKTMRKTLLQLIAKCKSEQ